MGKALQYLREAATKAATRSAHPEAAAHLEQAIGVLEHLPESRERAERAIHLRLALRNSLLPSGEYARIYEVLSEAEALARDLDDRRRLGRVTTSWPNTLGPPSTTGGPSTSAGGVGHRHRPRGRAAPGRGRQRDGPDVP